MGDAIAICCGFKNYQKPYTELKYAERDAGELYTNLTSNSMFQNKINHSSLITKDDATKDYILSKLSSAIQNINEGELVWFSFSGHSDIFNGHLYLILPKYNPHEKIDINKNKFLIPSSEIESLLRNNSRKKVLIILDSCKSGAFKNPGILKSRGTKSETIKDSFKFIPSGGVLISSVSEEGLSYESSSLLNGIFTRSIIDTIKDFNNKNSSLTVMDLFELSSIKTRQSSNPLQIPTLSAFGLNENFDVLSGKNRIKRIYNQIPTEFENEFISIQNQIISMVKNDVLKFFKNKIESLITELDVELKKMTSSHYVDEEDYSYVTRGMYSHPNEQIIATSTPNYLNTWQTDLGALINQLNKEFIDRGGKVLRIHFLNGEYTENKKSIKLTLKENNVIRDQLKVGVHVYIVFVTERLRSKINNLDFAVVDNRHLIEIVFKNSKINAEFSVDKKQMCQVKINDLIKILSLFETKIYRPVLNESSEEVLLGRSLNENEKQEFINSIKI